MQAELEVMVKYMDDRLIEVEREVADLRALLAGKVLCEKEVVGYRSLREEGGAQEPVFTDCFPEQYWRCRDLHSTMPLYAPASPLGNADTGKEGGK